MAEDKEEKKSFRVIDKRVEADAAEKKEKVKKETRTQGKEARKEEEQPRPVPEVNFSAFVYSLSTSAWSTWGDPGAHHREDGQKPPPGNRPSTSWGYSRKRPRELTQEEENLLNSFLYDLRMRYVKAMG